MGAVLPGDESDILKLMGRQRGSTSWWGGGQEPRPRAEAQRVSSAHPSCPQSLLFPSLFSLLPLGKAHWRGGLREKVAFVSPANVFIRKGILLCACP